jgi:hypothetical protein
MKTYSSESFSALISFGRSYWEENRVSPISFLLIFFFSKCYNLYFLLQNRAPNLSEIIQINLPPKMTKKLSQTELRQMMQKLKTEKSSAAAVTAGRTAVGTADRLKKYKLSSRELELIEVERKRKAEEDTQAVCSKNRNYLLFLVFIYLIYDF